MALEQELHRINTSTDPKTHSLAEIRTFLQANEILLKDKSNSRLQSELRELGRHVDQLYEKSPEKQQLVEDIQKLASDRFEGQLSKSAEILETIEASVLPGYFPPFVRQNGKIVDPVRQLKEFSQRLERHEVTLKKAKFRLPFQDTALDAENLSLRAQFIADVNFLTMLDHLEFTANKEKQHDPGREFLQSKRQKWIGDPARWAYDKREALQSKPISIRSYSQHEMMTLLPPEIAYYNIKRLRLTHTDGYLPETLTRMTQLSYLDISDPDLKTIPQQLFTLVHLETLNIKAGITEIPMQIGQLKKLTSLGLSENKLRWLPESLGELSQLKSLGLNQNQLDHLPKSLAKLNKLEFLLLSTNQLVEIPPWIGSLTALKRLYITANPIQAVANEIDSCKLLTDLICDAATLPYLPPSIKNIPALTHVGPYATAGHWAQSPNGPTLEQFLKALPLPPKTKLG